MIKYPLTFTCAANSKSGVQTVFEAEAEGLAPIPCAIPTAFMGPGGGYSPEDLFAMSVIACLIATFKVFAEKSQFTYTEIKAGATLTINRNEQGIPDLQKLDIDITLNGVEDETKARALLAEAEKYCLVSNAIKTEKRINYSILTE